MRFPQLPITRTRPAWRWHQTLSARAESKRWRLPPVHTTATRSLRHARPHGVPSHLYRHARQISGSFGGFLSEIRGLEEVRIGALHLFRPALKSLIRKPIPVYSALGQPRVPTAQALHLFRPNVARLPLERCAYTGHPLHPSAEVPINSLKTLSYVNASSSCSSLYQSSRTV